jgi:DNA-directed RNA polymerase subunit F
MNPEMISQEPITMAEVQERLDKSKKESELNFRAQKTHDYLIHNTLIKNDKKAQELKVKLEGLEILRLKETHVIKLIDTMPISVEEAKSILSTYPISVTNENLKKIVDTIDDFRKL